MPVLLPLALLGLVAARQGVPPPSSRPAPAPLTLSAVRDLASRQAATLVDAQRDERLAEEDVRQARAAIDGAGFSIGAHMRISA